MIWTENDVSVSSTSYTAGRYKWLGLPGALKVTFDVTDAPIFVQFLETRDRGAYDDPQGKEVKIARGFQSRTLPKRVYAYRIRLASATPTTVTVTAYG